MGREAAENRIWKHGVMADVGLLVAGLRPGSLGKLFDRQRHPRVWRINSYAGLFPSHKPAKCAAVGKRNMPGFIKRIDRRFPVCIDSERRPVGSSEGVEFVIAKFVMKAGQVYMLIPGRSVITHEAHRVGFRDAHVHVHAFNLTSFTTTDSARL